VQLHRVRIEERRPGVAALAGLLSLLIPPRHHGEEMIDRPGHPYAEVERSLRDIQWVNRNLAGWTVLRRYLPRLLAGVPADRAVRILDLGTGSADLPRAMVAWGRDRGRELRVIGIDNNPEVMECARRECAEEPAVRLVQADIFHLPFPPGSFDLVICSLFLHHFEPPEAVRLLRAMAAQARHGLLVNDLQRHRLAYWGIWILSRMMLKGELFRHDAPLSVLRAYRVEELRPLLREAGLSGLAVDRVFPFRLAAHGRPDR
jgi:SAM-dependent methyltransferase